MHITLCARSKILQILEPGSCFRISATGSLLAGALVDLIPNSEFVPGDSKISIMPLVVADINTVTLMAGRSIDYDYGSEEFVISNRDKN